MVQQVGKPALIARTPADVRNTLRGLGCFSEVETHRDASDGSTVVRFLYDVFPAPVPFQARLRSGLTAAILAEFVQDARLFVLENLPPQGMA